jgi:ribosomal protein S18 acetylase RimI-like enzyme
MRENRTSGTVRGALSNRRSYREIFWKMEKYHNLKIRNIYPEDHVKILEVMPIWWNGRDLTSSVLKVFFIHFKNTSFIAEIGNELAGFLIGFYSQSYENEGYIHFAGVNPEFRREGIGKALYQKFFDICKIRSINTVRSCTSPINKLSISFHTGIGFSIVPGDGIIDGISVSMNYLRENDPKVIFEKKLRYQPLAQRTTKAGRP